MTKRIRSDEYKAKQKEYGKKYYIEHKDEIRSKKMKKYDSDKHHDIYIERVKRNPDYYKIYASKAKLDFLDMYGGRCSCCGESIIEFLTIEHIQGQIGVKDKEKSTKAYRKATKEYRPDLYEILCYNCNCAKGMYGKCPHTVE